MNTVKDLKNQMNDLKEENEKFRQEKRKLEKTVIDQIKHMEDRVLSPTE